MNKSTLSLWRFLLAFFILMFTGVPASLAAVTQDGSATQAASAAQPSSDSVIPRLIQFSGMVEDTEGKPAIGSVGLTFSLYELEEGGSPLWVETQTVQLDPQGHYTVFLGAASPAGVPQDLFTSGSARWLGVQPALPGAGEQPRVLLVGVPYAFKAADAETLGGKPASAYVTTDSLNASGTSTIPSSAATASGTATIAGGQNQQAAAADPERKKASGTRPLTSCSSVTADGTATANQMAKFTAACTIHQSLLFDNGTDVGVGTTTPGATLDVNGNISGRDNLGLPQTTKSTLGVITFGGSSFIHACCSASADNTFIGVNAGNFTTTGVGHNTAAGFKALFANTTGNENTAAGYFALSANTTGSSNTATGHEALDFNTTGFNNTAMGFSAMIDNNSGTDNTAVGDSVLNFNTSGSFNTAVGETALGGNTTGKFNTGIGIGASVSSGNLINATAIGAEAAVAESNALVLGCASTTSCDAGGLNPSAVPPNVGIGTTTPSSTLDVKGNNTFEPLLVESPNTFGTWIQLANTSSGGITWYMISTASANGEGPGNLAFNNSNFNGTGTVVIHSNLQVDGNVSKGGGSFQIDHPLDPANKYLYHSFVESPDMMDIYNGNVTTNKQGLAVVVLPSYFEALNRDFRYQLTVMGQFAQAIVAKEISRGRFTIETNRPSVKVSWQVTGIRHDAYADAHRIPVEEEKPLQEQGKYLHPDLFGAPKEKAIGYSAPPPSPGAVPTPVALTVSTPIGAGQGLTFPASPVHTTASAAPVEPATGLK